MPSSRYMNLNLLTIDWSSTTSDFAETGYRLGALYICGVRFHVEALRITETEEGGQVPAILNTENISRLDDLFRLSNGMSGAFSTITLPDTPGNWILWITPMPTLKALQHMMTCLRCGKQFRQKGWRYLLCTRCRRA